MKELDDAYYIGLARQISNLGECDRKKVGAVIVDPIYNERISIGYNAPPSNIECTNRYEHINQCGCLGDDGRCLKAVHAEQQALLNAKQSVHGMTLYCTDEPCEHCAKLMLQAGIKRVVFQNEYQNPNNHHFIGDMEWVHYKEVSE